jgi:hypothetical protein
MTHEDPTVEDPHSQPRMLLPVPVDQLSAVEIAYDDNIHRFDRDAAGAWFYHAHVAKPGPEGESGHSHQTDQALAEFIAEKFTQFARTRMERDIARGGTGEAYGLERPFMLINIYGADPLQPLARYMVGDVAPDTVSRYVMVSDAQVVITIPDFHIDNLIDLIDGVTKPAG